MKKWRYTSIFLFLLILIIPTVLWISLKNFMPEVYENYSKDLGENRNKATITEPLKLLQSTEQLEDFYNDRVPFRSLIIETNRKITEFIEKPYNDYILPVLTKTVADNKENNDSQSTISVSEDISNMSGGIFEQTGPGSSVDSESSSSTEVSDSTGTGDVRADDPIEEPIGCEHDWIEVEVHAASCVEEGYYYYRCSICGEETMQMIPISEHSYILAKEQTADYFHYGYKWYICTACGHYSFEELTSKLIDDSYLAPVKAGRNQVLLGRFNWLYYCGDNAMDYYTGSNLPTESELTNYANKLRTLNQLCEERGKKLCVMVMPNKEQIYPEYMPTMSEASSNRRVPMIADYIKNSTNVSFVYPLDELKYMKIIAETYYKYDTHWNMFGAFVGTQALYAALGLETTDPRGTNIERYKMLAGDLISLAGYSYDKYNNETDQDEDYRVSYKYNTVSNRYNDDFLADGFNAATTDNPTYDKNIIVIGDSFRTRMIPYIEKDFKLSVFGHRNDLLNASGNNQQLAEELAAYLKISDYIVLAAVERDEKKILETADKMIEILRTVPAEE